MVLSPHILNWAHEEEERVFSQFRMIDAIVDHNQWKVIEAFQKGRISDYHFAESTGYGYNDSGREALDQLYATIFGAEAALVRPHFASGTHTITAALFGLLRPGDGLLYITGTPYDTLHKVIGHTNDGTGSLRDFQIDYDEVELLTDGQVNWPEVFARLQPTTKVIGIQRSRGYDPRPSYSIQEIGEMVKRVKAVREDLIVFVDNCYGEFTEQLEPTQVGADLIAGSLIKNPGGGIVSTGGYIAGRKHYVDLAAYRLTAPGIGGEIGAMMGQIRSMFQGIYLAPHVVGQALKGSIFTAAMMKRAGFTPMPEWNEMRSDIIQAIRFPSQDLLQVFVQAIQSASAVDAHVVPVPSPMPGYEHSVIMASGSFVQGGSLELSADAPMKDPSIAYMQGGLTYSHIKYAVCKAIERLL